MVTGAVLRVARPTDDLDAAVRFYVDGLGLADLGRFGPHDGYDGALLGHAGQPWHLELISRAGHRYGRAPNAEHLLVFYLPERADYDAAVARLARHGAGPVPSDNPYWDRCGITVEDPDGFRVVLANRASPC